MFLRKKKKSGEKAFTAEIRKKIIELAGTASVFDHSLCRPSKLASLAALAKEVRKRELTGDFVECGLYKGGSSALITHLLSPDCHAWLYDSFEGMPEVSEEDDSEAKQWEGECVASQEDVVQVMSDVGIPSERFTIRKGWFEDTFKEPLPKQIQYLHVDADWYDSVLLTLETFYPLVVEGGLIVLDDFGHWEGCRRAFYDYCEREKIRPLLDRFENDQAFWFKGREHNRDGWTHKAL